MTRPRVRPGADTGAAVVEFVLVGALTLVLFAAVLQVGYAVLVRNVLQACAGEGARYGALADRGPADAVRRTRELITADLSGRFATAVEAGTEQFAGLDTLVVRVRAPMPVLGPLGPAGQLEVAGHAVLEPR